MAGRKINVGIVGAGLIGRDHALSLARIRDVKALRVFDADGARAAKVAKEVGATTVGSLAELIDENDIVWICSPPFVHRAIVRDVCRAGKAIFCEKPLAHNKTDARAIREMVRRSRVPFFMGQSGRYSAAFLLMHSLLERGVVGKPTMFWSTRIGYLDPAKSPPWRIDDRKSGGAIVELGVHEIDFINWVGGAWRSVSATGSSKLVGPKFQDTVNAVGVMKNGALARVNLSWASPRYLWQRGIEGTDGALFADDASLREVVLHRPGKKPRIFLTRETDWMDRKTGENLSLRDQDRDVIAALRRGSPPPVTVDDGFAAVNVAFAARQSVKTSRTVRI